ncbi:hypothetical protein SEA_MABODAMACA_36 [Microbacterium phage Mabodamaca]|uniref:Uncharacterized protein n=1 Tax=Microbacterium phage Mabodamaca TaxID=3078574 RepID=A0AA96SEY2_9CAUD|nr:hypothetical protein SEA_MABODAMACA_36 [Microbacterium phage Mabodamaca]
MSERVRSYEDLTEGDLLRATKGDTVVGGRVATSYPRNIANARIGETGTTVRRLLALGFDVERLEKAPPVLPTEPGFYVGVDWGTKPALGYHLSESGQWQIIWSAGSSTKREPVPADLPLVRLVKPVF